MKPYLDLMQKVLDEGKVRKDRTGTGTISLFGTQTRYDLQKGFPLATTKRVFWKGILHELLWFLKGDTNTDYLTSNGVRIWNEWADENGDLGPVYGAQWMSWRTYDPKYGCLNYIDQIAQVIKQIKEDPYGRRHIVSAWNVGEIDQMALPPCHLLFQFYVRDDTYLDCQLYQRSADLFLGVAFNIASYALLMHMVAQVTGYKPGEFIHTLGDAHIYLNHMDQVKEQLSREPRGLPFLDLNPDIKHIDDFGSADIFLTDYAPHPTIKAPVSV